MEANNNRHNQAMANKSHQVATEDHQREAPTVVRLRQLPNQVATSKLTLANNTAADKSTLLVANNHLMVVEPSNQVTAKPNNLAASTREQVLAVNKATAQELEQPQPVATEAKSSRPVATEAKSSRLVATEAKSSRLATADNQLEPTHTHQALVAPTEAQWRPTHTRLVANLTVHQVRTTRAQSCSAR